MKQTKLASRLALYVVGLALLAAGNAFGVWANLGVAATASTGYVLSQTAGISFGAATMVFFALMVAAQLGLAERSEWIRALCQLPFGMLFALMMDLLIGSMRMENASLPLRWALLALSIALTACGVLLTVRTHILPTPPDGLCNAISQRFGFRFGSVKLVFDLVSVVLACLLSLAMCGQITGVGVGTAVSALLTGPAVKIVECRMQTRRGD